MCELGVGLDVGLDVGLGVGLGVSLGVGLGMKAWNYYPIRGGLRLVKLWSMTIVMWSTGICRLYIYLLYSKFYN